MNGYTYDPTPAQRIANMAAYVSPAALMDAAARSDGDIHRLERILSGYALAAINEQGQASIREALDADHDPRTDAERELDQWQRECVETQESARPY